MNPLSDSTADLLTAVAAVLDEANTKGRHTPAEIRNRLVEARDACRVRAGALRYFGPLVRDKELPQATRLGPGVTLDLNFGASNALVPGDPIEVDVDQESYVRGIFVCWEAAEMVVRYAQADWAETSTAPRHCVRIRRPAPRWRAPEIGEIVLIGESASAGEVIETAEGWCNVCVFTNSVQAPAIPYMCTAAAEGKNWHRTGRKVQAL
jgi:hypothetical protein